ncbi:MAG: hypothetical protein ACP5TY_04385, partial [Thermodesulforhabdaceae bacterium]
RFAHSLSFIVSIYEYILILKSTHFLDVNNPLWLPFIRAGNRPITASLRAFFSRISLQVAR